MPTPNNPTRDTIHEDGKMREDADVPRVPEDKVLEETARLAREGQQKLREREGGTAGGQTDTPRE
ncbi:MAG: hypothetical protein HY854_11630 [Burkholderiales bacterium]|nr:hypothetical protein [Burkholderiales bacterium]